MDNLVRSVTSPNLMLLLRLPYNPLAPGDLFPLSFCKWCPNLSSIVVFPWRWMEDTKYICFLKMHFLLKVVTFVKNGQIFAWFSETLKFSGFSTMLSMVPTISTIFSLIDLVLAKVWPQKSKISVFWILKFLIKVENAPDSTDHISGTGNYFVRRFAVFKPQRKLPETSII